MPEQERLDSQVGKTARRFAVLAFITAGFTYALVVFGGIVRINGSGMGCGHDWPLCNGQLIPPMDFETLIEYGHRLAAVLVGFLLFAVALYGVQRRRTPGLAGHGVSGLAVGAATLLIVQVLVGAITVRLELPAGTVVLHLAIASALLALLLIAGLRALTKAPAVRETSTTYPHWALAAAGLGFVALLLGGAGGEHGRRAHVPTPDTPPRRLRPPAHHRRRQETASQRSSA
jgi:heme A synthase